MVSDNLSRGMLDLIAEILKELRPDESFFLGPWTEGELVRVVLVNSNTRLSRVFDETFLAQGRAAAISADVRRMFRTFRAGPRQDSGRIL